MTAMLALLGGLLLCVPSLVLAGGRPLDLPPILSGYHGKRYKNPKTGGLLDVTLNNYVTTKKFFNSRGTWYDITKWAARNHNCDKYPSSVACMACAQNMPSFTRSAGVVPIAVADRLFGFPEKGATCGMCLRVYMPQSYKRCKNHLKNPYCAGEGSKPYVKYVKAKWAWGAKVRKDSRGYYFTALIIEWFDRAQELPYQLTYPTQGVGPTTLFGDWPVKYKAVPCPVAKHGLELQFLDFSKPVPVETGICNNQFGKPCGGKQILHPGRPLGYMKLMITSQRIPISAVDVKLGGKWQALRRSGDGYWEPKATARSSYKAPTCSSGSVAARSLKTLARASYQALPLNGKLQVRISCASGTRPRQVTVVPGKMLCSYQNPKCYGRQVRGVQC